MRDVEIVVLLCVQACVPTDFSNPVTVKNHNELLRCFNVMGWLPDMCTFTVFW